VEEQLQPVPALHPHHIAAQHSPTLTLCQKTTHGGNVCSGNIKRLQFPLLKKEEEELALLLM